MIRKVLLLIGLLTVAIAVYYYTRKKKAGDVPFGQATPADTAQALGISNDAAAIIDERRNMMADNAASNPDVKTVQSVAEKMTWNGKSYPILGYAHEGSKNETIVMIPIEFTSDFKPYPGGTLSAGISGKVTINTGKYAGTYNAWYIYTKDTWASQRTNVYIDAPWKG